MEGKEKGYHLLDGEQVREGSSRDSEIGGRNVGEGVRNERRTQLKNKGEQILCDSFGRTRDAVNRFDNQIQFTSLLCSSLGR